MASILLEILIAILIETTFVCNVLIIVLSLVKCFYILGHLLFSVSSLLLFYSELLLKLPFKANTSPGISRSYSAFTKSHSDQKKATANALECYSKWMLFFNNAVVHATYLWTSLFCASKWSWNVDFCKNRFLSFTLFDSVLSKFWYMYLTWILHNHYMKNNLKWPKLRMVQ